MDPGQSVMGGGGGGGGVRTTASLVEVSKMGIGNNQQIHDN